MSPAPNTGVGMRKIMLRLPPWPVIGFPAGRKFGWAMLQPAASVRPVMTKRLCTPPSGVPFGFRLKRASRIGPLFVMNHGDVFFAPLSLATAIKGFAAGLVPPTAGCKWQDEHWLELKRGPSPLLSPPVTTLNVLKSGEPVLEELSLVRREAGQGSASSWRAAARARIDGPCRRWSPQSS